jgi:hypothetical protein
MRRFLPFLAVAAVALGCSGPATAPLEPARLSLTVAPGGIDGPPGASGNRLVRLTIRHDGGRAVALSGCPHPPSVRIERREGTTWREAGSYGLICLAIYSSSTVKLAPGARIETVVTAGTAGRYRFVVPVGPDEAAPEFELRSAAVDLP